MAISIKGHAENKPVVIQLKYSCFDQNTWSTITRGNPAYLTVLSQYLRSPQVAVGGNVVPLHARTEINAEKFEEGSCECYYK